VEDDSTWTTAALTVADGESAFSGTPFGARTSLTQAKSRSQLRNAAILSPDSDSLADPVEVTVEAPAVEDDSTWTTAALTVADGESALSGTPFGARTSLTQAKSMVGAIRNSGGLTTRMSSPASRSDTQASSRKCSKPSAS